ncbi:glycerate kinase [Herbiconiux sp. CPCC 203407]|uniref:Glycerate kinase n=1 Tax=Herbiconiux oxytropis TaxID=2970915 RepID=A0AA41XEN8_9MICO|nr:glycerate kinase [Herbiconiux oxytropis]MCS5723968.1 glycerate kinase [Herbiconiux oxytropis]MCS5726811.1 glycerate kinase [Herbiconiux oxytropis]
MASRVVIAPDSFKGTATAVEAAEWLAEGWLSVCPGDDVVRIPMADGGEGALDAFELARPDARRIPVTVTGPDDRVIEATWLWLPPTAVLRGVSGAADRLGGTAVVELASTSGITLLDRLRPLEAHTIGFGQAIRAALDAGVDEVVLAIGGSSSTDGGAGALEVLGASFTGDDGRPVAPGNGGLASIRRADLSTLRALPPGGVAVLSDVDNPLLGRRGAVAVFGLQKGIEEGLAPQAEANLAVFARVLAEATGIDPETPGAGAAGGTGFGLLAWGARLTPGATAVAELLRLPERLAGVDVVITGEGRFDDQSEAGKVPTTVRDLARAADAGTSTSAPVRVALVAGAIEGPTASFDDAVALTDLAGSAAAAMADPRPHLVAAGAALASRGHRHV